ncbi:MAG: V-type ATP synthase subunit D [Calditrichaeota bacterium]|nr:MAG: V-type ATP synthase subunit D [Calditrichota bacterium]
MDQISANRMTLLKLRRRLAMARRGHELLKYKLDELSNRFRQEIRMALDQEVRLTPRLKQMYSHWVLGSGHLFPHQLETLASKPRLEIQENFTRTRILTSTVPDWTVRAILPAPPYGLLNTPAELDPMVEQLTDLVPELIELAVRIRRLETLTRQIETTRRRVNALEFALIPQMEAQIKFIELKLSENERANTSRLMRIKSILAGEAGQSAEKPAR